MTRFARAGQINQKKPHEASSWSELTESQRKNKKHKEGQERNNERKSLLVKKKAKIHKHDKPKGLHEKATELAVNLPEVEKKELFEFVKKDEKRENRRLKRIKEKQVEKVCYHCRKPGHAMGDCPEHRQDLDQGTGICFKCGSTEHNSASCRVRLPSGEFPYAKCFICGETGHLSKQCPDNPRGLYPKGGCCNECGSVEHYQRDCPEKQKKQGIDDWRLPKLNAFGSADDDPSLHQPPPSTSKQRQGPKMVKF